MPPPESADSGLTAPNQNKTTLQCLKKIPGVAGLYRHENGSYYGKKKLRGTKKVICLKSADGRTIYERKAAETALRKWGDNLDKPPIPEAKKTLSEWFAKLKEQWGGKADATVDKVDYARRLFELDYEELKAPKPPNLLTLPINQIKPSDLSTFFARLAKRLGHHAFNGTSRIIKSVFEIAVMDGALSENPYAKVPKTIRRKKIILTPAQAPTIEQCQAICDDVRSQIHSPNAEVSADMLEFIHKAALGLAESVFADWEKVKWESNYIEVKRQKTGAYFKVPIYEHLKPFLVGLWERQGKPTAGKLFSILSPKQALYNACRRLGYENYSPIDFRKARITWMLRKGIPVELLAKFQGHKDNGVLIRKTYSWIISEGDSQYEQEQLKKLSDVPAAMSVNNQ